MLRFIMYVGLLSLITGCGSAYIPQEVSEAGAGFDVEIVLMTPGNVDIANKQTDYAPRQLPAVFNTTATGSNARFGNTLPEPPLQSQVRPSVAELRVPPPFEAGPYRIGVGDTLAVVTRQGAGNVEEVSGVVATQNRRQMYVVQENGSISVPEIGSVRVAGLTVSEAETIVFRSLVENQIDPSFSLEIAEFGSQRISIGGAVREPALVPVTLNPLTLNEGLLQVGGVQATDQEFTLIRIFRDGQIFQIPLVDFYQREDLQQIALKSGDSIFVDVTYDLARAEAFFEQQIRLSEISQDSRARALADLQTEVALRRSQLDEQRANFRDRVELGAEERDYVYLTGEVSEPRRFPLPFENKANLADALFQSGGLRESTANPEQIYVLRSSDSASKVTAWQLNASNPANFAMATQFELRPNDIIFVAPQPVTNWSRTIQQITPSLIVSGIGAATG